METPRSGFKKQVTIQRTDHVHTRANVGPMILKKMVGWIRLTVVHGTHPSTGKLRKSQITLSKSEAEMLGRILVKFSEEI